MNGADINLSLEDAKAAAMAMELELASMVPSDQTEAIEQLPKGALIGCGDAERSVQWSGRTDVVTSGPVDVEGVVDAIVAEYAVRDDYDAERADTSFGPRAYVTGHHGAGYLVHESADGSRIEFISFSPCFILPEGESGAGAY
ncbi:hypothetical protein H9651_05780 [Microbacterium sp. Sa4CUA7]|uniref:Uncharacterized protein n=1 Tax=Microbacterium pullorum TaxID=2762236 RepID=A0ABR8S1B6_9MICO|nr:hypothetical protein [Microbacterium pullorum]MBD7957139.1 hypothetical protein [Microbacterium pullorum]